MQLEYHYYATYIAAFLAGYTVEESKTIAYSSAFVDCCSETLLDKLDGPSDAVTFQYCSEMLENSYTITGLLKTARIWSSYHFLPYDLKAVVPKRPRLYLNRYRMLCKPNGSLMEESVKLAQSSTLQAVGLAMHVVADTWAHQNFAGIPSNVINNINSEFYEIVRENGKEYERKAHFHHTPIPKDNFETGSYSSSLPQDSETSVMNIGHGRLGHIPDYSFIRYRYLPAWNDYRYITKDNPSDYYHALMQMTAALKFLNGSAAKFHKNQYAEEELLPWKDEIMQLLEVRRLSAEEDWKALAAKITGTPLEDFSIEKYQKEYQDASEKEKNRTFLGKFFMAAILQKSMVTHAVFSSGNLITGISVDVTGMKMKSFKKFARRLRNWIRSLK